MGTKVIELQGLYYSYPGAAGVLNDINLDVFEGETLGIIGPNGAGKTTLLLHLNGILGKGRHVKILGMEMTKETMPRIRAHVGLVFQNPDDQLFMPTVFDDVAFGPINMGLNEEKVRRLVGEALTAVGMQGFSHRLAHHLSSGEKKRISIATVLSMKPKILVLDEPSSNMDPRSRRQLIELLKEFTLTKIVAGHDLELMLEICSRIVVLSKGRIIAQGLPEIILSDRALMTSSALEIPISLGEREGIHA